MGRLVLSRKPGQSIEIDGGIEIKVVAVNNAKTVRLMISAPEHIGILRKELLIGIADDDDGDDKPQRISNNERTATHDNGNN